jgi:hypothetical protein
MACACKGSDHGPSGPEHEVWMDSLDSIGWRDLGQRALDIHTVVGRSHHYLRKAERAESLGLGDEQVAFNRRAAERENRQAARLIRGVQGELRDLTEREEWRELSGQLDEAFRTQDGEGAFRDMRERWVEWLYEESNITGGDAEEVITVIDQAHGAAQEGMTSLVRHFDERLTEMAAQRDDPNMGREPSSPLSAAQVACLVVVGILTAAATVACLLTPFCWCCYGWQIALAAAASTAACLFGVQ